MSFILVDSLDEKRDLQLNAWHWRTILSLLEASASLPKERLEVMGMSGACPKLSREEARLIASAIRSKILSGLKPNERIMIDGTLTTEPDDGTFFRDPREQHKNYSTNAVVLNKLCAFCESCDGFTIY
jgi:hypothetical protein